MPHRDIPLQPEITSRLRIAAKQGIVVPFVGAGVSQLCGCPGWDDFANAGLKFFMQPGMLDHAQYDLLSRLPARVKISVAVGLERQYGRRIQFDKILQVTDPAKKHIGEQVYGNLGALARTFVTTNYDDWLDTTRAIPPPLSSPTAPGTKFLPTTKRALCYRVADFTEIALSSADCVFHIHGTAADRDSMLLTTSDYLERYASHRMDGSNLVENPYLEFLGHLFASKSVLFIGYGLAELEILEYIIQKSLGVQHESSTPTSIPGLLPVPLTPPSA